MPFAAILTAQETWKVHLSLLTLRNALRRESLFDRLASGGMRVPNPLSLQSNLQVAGILHDLLELLRHKFQLL